MLLALLYFFVGVLSAIVAFYAYLYYYQESFVKRVVGNRKNTNGLIRLPFNFGFRFTWFLFKALQENRAYNIVGDYMKGKWDLSTKTEFNETMADSLVFNNSICIMDPLSMKQLFITKALKFSKGDHYSALKLALGDGLLISEGAIWKKQRSLLNTVFTTANVRKMNSDMRNLTLQFIKDLQSKIDSKEKNVEIQFEKHMSELTLRIVTAAVFGDELSFASRMAELWSSVVEKLMMFLIRSDFIPYYRYLPLPSSLQLRKDVQEITSLVHDIIHIHEEKIAKEDCLDEQGLYRSKDGKCCLMPLLLTIKDSEGNRISKQQIIDESLTFTFAGHDTTSSLVSFVFWMLATHPEIQERCIQEVDSHFSTAKVNELEEEDFLELKFMKQVLNETLRLYPPVRVVMRNSEDDIEMPNGYTCPKGTKIFVNILGLHRNPKVWERADEFDPDRWSDERLEKSFPENGPISLRYAFVPFVLGVRNCIGKDFAFNEGLVICSLLLYYFRVEMTEEAKKQMFVQTSLVSCPVNLKLRLTQRKSLQL